MSQAAVKRLVDRGVRVKRPDSVYVDADLNPDSIDAGTTIYPGCRLLGGSTSIGPGCTLGSEGPLTISHCQLGTGVTLAGGTATDAVFLDGASVGSCTHIRAGTILEEQASAAHSVGLKQTILMPYVTLGSLVNFCDCLMAGGTDSKNHSEVGSSYVHFNFTAHQDKATASLLGDVPRGVRLDQLPIFLGGQGGLVGPARIEYGTVVAAGTVYRRDVTEPGRLVFGEVGPLKGRFSYTSGLYGDVSRIIRNNMIYIGNVVALREWYRVIRSSFLSGSPSGAACLAGAVRQLDAVLTERLARMAQLSGKMERSLALAREAGINSTTGGAHALQQRLFAEWADCQARIESLETGTICEFDRREVVGRLPGDAGRSSYLAWGQGLQMETRAAATRWLQGVVDAVAACWTAE